jgi:hypothetical protein
MMSSSAAAIAMVPASLVMKYVELISVSWFGPPSEVNFGPLGISFVGFVDGATEAELADQERQGGVV